jgi:D-alanyl-D-alanine carboxypeptidase
VNTLAAYSEHHSGCAVDIGSNDAAVLETDFEDSQAFKWLSNKATKFNFKLSYPRNNDSGIIYEPWHWCYQKPE